MLKRTTIELMHKNVERKMRKAQNQKEQATWESFLIELNEVFEVLDAPQRVYLVSEKTLTHKFNTADFASIVFIGKYVNIREICNFPGESVQMVSISCPEIE